MQRTPIAIVDGRQNDRRLELVPIDATTECGMRRKSLGCRASTPQQLIISHHGRLAAKLEATHCRPAVADGVPFFARLDKEISRTKPVLKNRVPQEISIAVEQPAFGKRGRSGEWRRSEEPAQPGLRSRSLRSAARLRTRPAIRIRAAVPRYDLLWRMA